MLFNMLLGCSYAAARMFWVVTRVLCLVARRLIKFTVFACCIFVLLLLLGWFGLLPGCFYAVTKMFWMVARVLLCGCLGVFSWVLVC